MRATSTVDQRNLYRVLLPVWTSTIGAKPDAATCPSLMILSGSFVGPLLASFFSKDGAVTTSTSRTGAPRDDPTAPVANAVVCFYLIAARSNGSSFEAANS